MRREEFNKATSKTLLNTVNVKIAHLIHMNPSQYSAYTHCRNYVCCERHYEWCGNCK